MELREDYPLNLTKIEIQNILIFLNQKIKSTLNEGEKTDLFWKIRLGQNQLLFLSLQENSSELGKQKDILQQSIKDNRTTSRNNKNLSYILIGLALITVVFQVIPILKKDQNRLFLTKIEETKSILNSNLRQLETLNLKLDTIKSNSSVNLCPCFLNHKSTPNKKLKY